MAPPNCTIVSNHLRRLVKIFFGAFGAWYFLCFLGQVPVPPPLPEGGGEIAKGGARFIKPNLRDCKGGGGEGAPPSNDKIRLLKVTVRLPLRTLHPQSVSPLTPPRWGALHNSCPWTALTTALTQSNPQDYPLVRGIPDTWIVPALKWHTS